MLNQNEWLSVTLMKAEVQEMGRGSATPQEDSGSKEKCCDMTEQAHCGSHPGYSSKQDPSAK